MREPTNEAQLVANLIKAVRQTWPEAWVVKVHGGPYQEAGIPDLLVCLPPHGLLVGLEAKFQRPGESAEHARGRATPGQHAQIARLQRAGGTAGVVLSVAEGLQVLREAEGRIRAGEGNGTDAR